MIDDSILATIQNLTLVAALWMTGIGLGMMVRISDIARSMARVGLVARTLTLDVVVVPLLMWAAVRLLVQDDAYATGLLLVAFAAAGPLGLKLSQVSGADTAYAIGIVVVLEAANIVLIPLWSGLLDVTSSADVLGDMIRTVALLVLLPLGIGMAIRRMRPDHAAMLADGALRLATIGLLVVVTVVVVRGVDTMLEAFTNGAALASVVVIAFALAAGWLLGGPARPTRLTTSLVTGCRANGAALAVATSAFASVPGVAAGVVTAGLVSITLPTLMAYFIAWRTPALLPEVIEGS